jgi:hypothetical protein
LAERVSRRRKNGQEAATDLAKEADKVKKETEILTQQLATQ